MILDKIYRISLTCQKIEQKTVQTSPLFLNQIANFVTVNSEKTLNSCQITKKYTSNREKLRESCKKMREVAKRCEKMRKVAESCEKLRNCEISKRCDFRNFRNRAKFQRV